MIITIKFQTIQEVGTFSYTSNQFFNKISNIFSPAPSGARPSMVPGRRPLTMCSETGSVLRSGYFMSWQQLCRTQQPTPIDNAVSTLEFTKLRMRHHIFNNPKAFSMLTLQGTCRMSWPTVLSINLVFRFKEEVGQMKT